MGQDYPAAKQAIMLAMRVESCIVACGEDLRILMEKGLSCVCTLYLGKMTVYIPFHTQPQTQRPSSKSHRTSI